MSGERLTCRDCVEFLDDYIDGALNDAARTVFEQHLAKCPPCRDYVRTYRDTIRLSRECMCGESERIPHEVPERLIMAILEARCAGRRAESRRSSEANPRKHGGEGCCGEGG